MTKISTYTLDEKITALDKWIGSDVNTQNRTKNFTPKKLAEYFNEDQVINIGVPLQYKYYTLDPLEARPNGTLTFETEIGPTVNFSSVTSFILSKYTTKQNIVSDFLNFLDGSKVLLFKSSDINSFGFYRISDIAIYDENSNFFVVTVEYETGNGFMQEDEDYMISLVSLAGDFIPTKTSELINDGEDGVNPFISELDINREEWDAAYEGKINSAEVTGDTTKTLTLTKQDGSTIEASWTDKGLDLELTTEGTSGEATLVGSVLNIPDYTIDTSEFVHIFGDEFVYDVKKFFQTDAAVSQLRFDNSRAIGSQPSIYMANTEGSNSIFVTNQGSGTGIGISNTDDGYGQVITNDSIGVGLLVNNNGSGTIGLGGGVKIIGSSYAPSLTISNSAQGDSIFINSIGASAGTPINLQQDGVTNFQVNKLGDVTANKFIKTGGTSAQYLMADGTVSTGPILTGYVPYTGATQDVDLGLNQLKADSLAVSTTSTESVDVGEIVWNQIDGTFDMGLLNGVTLQSGQELHIYGKALGVIADGDGVMFAGSQGDHLLLAKADQDIINVNPEYFIGVATQDFVNNEFGYITILGKVRELNTLAYNQGDVLYFASQSTTHGALTATMPVAPYAKIVVAAVVRVHANQGILMVRPHIMPKINDIQDMYLPSPSNNEGIFWNSATLRYENDTIIGALGYTPYNATNPSNYITLLDLSSTATGLTYNNATGVFSLTGGYVIPTTIEETNWNTAYSNRITSASSPLSIASNIISISQAGSSTNGYLSSSDWNVFNNKQAAGNYITALTGEATASGPGSASVTLSNSAVTGKVLSGVNITGGTVVDTDTMLIAFGKLQNQINGLIGGSLYQGTWDASTNTPTITSSVGVDGNYYIVNVAGTTTINGISDWQVGDWIIFHDSAWQKVDNTDAVVSVNGFTGAVSLTTSNIAEGTNLYYTEARVNANTNVAANTAARHNAVTIGTANGLSLSTQQLSLGLANGSSNGALSSTDWNVFNSKQSTVTLTTTGNSGSATFVGGTLNIPTYTLVGLGGQPLLGGTGIVKSVSGTISYLTDNSSNWNDAYTYRLTSASSPLSLSGNALSISQAGTASDGYLSFTDWNTFNNKQVAGNYVTIDTAQTITASKTFTVSTVTDGILVNNSAGRGIRINNSTSSSLFGLIINNETASTATSFAVQKSGTTLFTINDAGEATGIKFIKTGGTSAQYLMADGSVSTLSNPITGAGTTNYLPKFTGVSTLGNSLIYDNGTNVGIGTTSPVEKFVVSNSGAQGLEITPNFDSTSNRILSYNRSSSIYNSLVLDGVDHRFLTSSSERMRVASSGNVLISTTTDAGYKLDVNGTFRTKQNSLLGENTTVGNSSFAWGFPGANYGQMQNVSSTVYGIGFGGTPTTIGTTVLSYNTSGNVGIGTTSPSQLLHLYKPATDVLITLQKGSNYGYVVNDGTNIGFASNLGSTGYKFLVNRSAPDNAMIINSSGNVGIGTTSPIGNAGSTAMQIVGTDYPVFTVTSSNQSINGRLGVGFGNAYVGTTTNHPFLFITNDTERMRITSGGSVLVNTTSLISNDSKMEIKGDSSNYCLYLNAPVIYAGVYRFQRFYANGSAVGDITSNGSSTSYNTTSDYRLKQDFKPFNGLDLVSKIKVYDYAWKVDNSRMNGVIAHELQEVVPYAVTGEKDAEQMQSVDYSKLVPILVQAIQELKAEIEILKNK